MLLPYPMNRVNSRRTFQQRIYRPKLLGNVDSHSAGRLKLLVTLGLLKECKQPIPAAVLLRRSSASACFLGLWVRSPQGAWMSILSVVCCQVELSATS